MSQQTNPFLQHAVNHGKSLLNEINRTHSLSQEIISTCDNITMCLNSGNTQSAINSIQNVKDMANQVSQSSEFFNQAINERLDMVGHVLGKIQYRVNQMSSAIQSVRGTPANYQTNWDENRNWMPQQQMTSSQQQMWGQYGGAGMQHDQRAPGQYGYSSQQ
jgi:uncharacterized phage infection (PIP) family protein YhgE